MRNALNDIIWYFTSNTHASPVSCKMTPLPRFITHCQGAVSLTTTSAKIMEEMTMHLEEDAANVLRYMASNGLIANASKTSLVILNLKSNKSNSGTNLIKVKI